MKVRLHDVELYPCLGIDTSEWAVEAFENESYEVPNELIEAYLQKEKELAQLEKQIRTYMR